MRPLTRRIPGSRSLTPPALALAAILTVVGAASAAWLLHITRGASSAEAMLPALRLAQTQGRRQADHLALHAEAERWIDATFDDVIPAPQSSRSTLADHPVVQAPDSSPSGPTFNGRRIRPVRTLSMLVTAYSPDARSCGKWADGKTASGYSVWTNGMKLVAADTSILPFGSIITVPGYNGGRPVPVLDRGGKIKGQRLDVLYPTHDIAKKWGAQRLDVVVWEYAE